MAPIHIAGAGPAGLAAAIALQHRGAHAVIYERKSGVGSRFNGDFQGLENWSTRTDVRTALNRMGIDAEQLPLVPIERIEVWFADKGPIISDSKEPLFYLVRRGSDKDTLDTALLAQAESAGAEVHFDAPLETLREGGLVAGGPHAADIIAEGVTFQQQGPDLAVGVIDDDLAPAGYAYLLRHGGKCTIATVLWRDFKTIHECLDRTLNWFADRYHISSEEGQRFGGYGNFYAHLPSARGNLLYLGESGGLQDFLFGFGMRYAFRSAELAALAMVGNTYNQPGEAYSRLIEQQVRPSMRASLVNRAIFEALGPAKFTLAPLIRKNARGLLRILYNEGIVKRAMSPLITRAYHSRLTDKSCQHVDCNCVWCRHGRTHEVIQ